MPIITNIFQCSQLDSISRNGGITDSNPNVAINVHHILSQEKDPQQGMP
jgi:hypothetical protein